MNIGHVSPWPIWCRVCAWKRENGSHSWDVTCPPRVTLHLPLRGGGRCTKVQREGESLSRLHAHASSLPHPAHLRCASLPLQGRVKRSRSRDAPGHPSFCSTDPKTCLQKNEGRQSAERCSRGPCLRARPRPQRGPLTFRRSTAALASSPQANWLSSRPCFLGRGKTCDSEKSVSRNDHTQLVRLTGVTRLRLSQSRDCTSHTGHSAGVTDARSRPGAECKSARGHRSRSVSRCASRTRPSPRARWVPLFGLLSCCQGIISIRKLAL